MRWRVQYNNDGTATVRTSDGQRVATYDNPESAKRTAERHNQTEADAEKAGFGTEEQC
jgi:hypothetical protein